MNDLSATSKPLVFKPVNKVRFVTAASLFDGHDASINIMRRILQATGCEVIHLGHNRSVEEIVNCALQEDAHGIAISSYQGGHVEYFKYMLDLLRERGAGAHQGLRRRRRRDRAGRDRASCTPTASTRIFSPEDGQRLGLQGMINEIVAACDVDLAHDAARRRSTALTAGDAHARTRALARLITGLEAGTRAGEAARRAARRGGAGDADAGARHHRHRRRGQELAHRRAGPPLPPRPAATGCGSRSSSIDPSRRKSGGALLGDRIRMNALEHPHIFMRSLATRDAGSEIAAALPDVDRRVQGRGLRPRRRRDLRHRPGRRRDRAARRRRRCT